MRGGVIKSTYPISYENSVMIINPKLPIVSESGFRPGDSFETRLDLKLRPQQHWGISATQYSTVGRVPSE